MEETTEPATAPAPPVATPKPVPVKPPAVVPVEPAPVDPAPVDPAPVETDRPGQLRPDGTWDETLPAPALPTIPPEEYFPPDLSIAFPNGTGDSGTETAP